MGDEISNAGAGTAESMKQDVKALEVVGDDEAHSHTDLNVAYMTPEHRARVEKKMKRKLDARCALFVLIYIMNYLDVRSPANIHKKSWQRFALAVGQADTVG